MTAQSEDTSRNGVVRAADTTAATFDVLDAPTRALVRLSAMICAADEAALRDALGAAVGVIDARWVEELVLQSYLFAGLPRALNAMREWRRVSGTRAPAIDDDATRDDTAAWRARGEATCEAVYGKFYERLRHNIAELHPALDAWMIVEGYGKVIGRDGLDLKRRELCIVSACAALGQERQLHSHLHGALNVGASPDEIDAALDAIRDVLPHDAWDRAVRLWKRVRAH